MQEEGVFSLTVTLYEEVLLSIKVGSIVCEVISAQEHVYVAGWHVEGSGGGHVDCLL